MKLLTPLAALVLPLTTCLAAKVTFYEIATQTTDPFPPGFETFVPLGVGSDGATTYSEEAIASVYVEQQLNPGFYTSNGEVLTKTASKTTYTSDAVTYHATLVADASHFSYHRDSQPTGTFEKEGQNADCKLDGKGGGVCVQEVWFDGDTLTATTTVTGVAVPYYTLNVADSQIKDSTKGNGAVSGVAVGSMFAVTIFGIVIGQLFVL